MPRGKKGEAANDHIIEADPFIGDTLAKLHHIDVKNILSKPHIESHSPKCRDDSMYMADVSV